MLLAYLRIARIEEAKELLENIEKNQYLCQAEELERRMSEGAGID